MRKYILVVFVLCIGQVVLGQITYPPSGQSTYIINSGQTISVTDGQSITFGPGTHIKSGATFSAVITEVTTATDPYASVSLSNENYVFTRSYYKPMPSFSTSGLKEGDVMEAITYYDGLGRPMQAIGIKGAPDKEDLITHMEYDEYGRQAKDWLPYHEPIGNLGAYRGDKTSATQSYYKNNYGTDFPNLSTSNVNAYLEKEFEASPLNRMLKQAAPGEDWKLGNGHEIAMEYQTNASSEVRYFKVNTTFANNTYTPSLAQNGYYDAGELYKTVTKDENWTSGTDHTTEEFTDKQGRVVLKRTYNGTAHDTYYVYDNYGNLTYVIPPKVTTGSVSTTELDELCYQYKYDHRNRLVEKKIPGKGWEYIVYNKLDQPIMAQDPNLDAQNKWLFTKYDAFGRVAYTGIDTGNSSNRIAVQNTANNQNSQYENRTSGANSYAGTTVYYSKAAYPDSFNEVFTINYYDTYVDTDGLSVPATVLGQAKATNTQGLATVSKVRVLDTNDWITTITGYDAKGRPIYTASKNNYLNTMDIMETELDFGGRVLRTKTTHTKGSNAAIVSEDTFTYDHEGRLLRQKQTINGQGQETIADNTYDDLGQLAQKAVGGGLQTVDYDYNVRGWLKSINNTASLGNDLFAFDINYNTADHGATALYNGNISETEWRTANDNTLRWYKYDYDALNRITGATDNTGNYNLYDLTYDKNGNILSLKRKGNTNAGATSFGTMDNLTYHYSSGEVSNKLLRVRDWTTNAEGFKDSASPTSDDYTYDQNGNMLRDLNKGINTDIGYNHLNLPTSVTLSSGTISYIYDATGVKLKKTVGSSVTEYAGNYIYENGNLQFFSHAEGYVDVEGGYDYVYQYKDHLGNVRLSYMDNNGTLEIIEENNYYPFGLQHKGYNNVINGTEHPYKYNGKELNEELGLDWYDYGWRNYDPTIGRFMNIDPLADKYPEITPYHYTSNNPVLFVDYDGRDFGLTFDFENGTVTISATYYASQDDTEAAQNAVAYWNDQSGNFSYEYTDEDGNTQTLTANFELSVETVEIEEGANKQRSLLAAANGGPAGESNIFSVVNDGDLTGSDGTERNGMTLGGVNVKIERDRLGTETGGHEVGHTLGITHSSSGIMTAAQTDPNRSETITQGNVSSIVYYPIKSTPENPTGARTARNGRGQATLHFQNATEVNSPQTNRGFRRFRNGRIITNE